jgi:hypothetical protein
MGVNVDAHVGRASPGSRVNHLFEMLSIEPVINAPAEIRIEDEMRGEFAAAIRVDSEFFIPYSPLSAVI